MTESLTALSAKLWGAPLLALLLGTGMFLTVRTGFGTWRNLPGACALLLSPGVRHSDGGISPLAALMTALASTLGTGNIVGVATALTFVLIHSDRDVLLIPLLDTLGTLIAALMVLPQLRRLGLHAGAGLRLAFTKIGNDFWVIRLK